MKVANVKLINVNSTGKRVENIAKLLELLSSYVKQSTISKLLKISEGAVSRAKNRYIKKGLINQDKTLTKEGLQVIGNVKSKYGTFKNVKSDSVRGHNLVFTLSLPKISKWNNREQYLESKKIGFKHLSRTNGQRIYIDKRKIWLNNKTINFYMGRSYFEENADLSMKEALDDLFSLIENIEKRLKISLRFTNGYKIRVSRQHYALVKNALAKKYNEDKNSLHVRDESGLWLIIDNSFQMNELETVHSKTAQEDNKPIQDFFNDLKQNPATISQINNAIMSSIQMQDVYNKNIKKHLKVLGKMEKALDSINKKI